ncbi:MAG: CHC2 zinc finger domain-containing protein [Vulcanimicrobiaceae bacterium]
MDRERFPIFDTYTHITGNPIKARRTSINVPCFDSRAHKHGDATPSCTLDSDKDVYFCHGCGKGGDAVSMVLASGVLPPGGAEKDRFRAAFAWLRTMHDRPMPAYDGPRNAPTSFDTFDLIDVTRLVYTFVDRLGQPLYDEVRLEGYDPTILQQALRAGVSEPQAREQASAKRIFQRRRLPKGRWFKTASGYRYYDTQGQPVVYGDLDDAPIELPLTRYDGSERPLPTSPYVHTLRGLPRVLYRLPTVLAAGKVGRTIVFVEGPKKADAVARRLNLTATTLAGGARAEFTLDHAIDCIGASNIIVLMDSDEGGRTCAFERAALLAETVGDVRCIDLFGDDSKRDIIDWLADRGRANAETLRTMLSSIASSAARIGTGRTLLPATPLLLT